MERTTFIYQSSSNIFLVFKGIFLPWPDITLVVAGDVVVGIGFSVVVVLGSSAGFRLFAFSPFMTVLATPKRIFTFFKKN